MKSLWGTLGLVKSSSSLLDGSPKPAAGLLSSQEEEQLNHLWVDIVKSEEGCRKLNHELLNYQDAIKNVQDSDEALIKSLSDSGVLTLSSQLRDVADEHLSVAMELKSKGNETCTRLQSTMGDSVRQYHGLYEHLDVLRKKRDAQLIEVQRIQEKLDRLKLKGKRTTDIIVEKDRAYRHLKELNVQLLTEAKKFHEMRVSFLQPCLQAQVQLQLDYYGTSTSEYNKHIQVSRGANTVKDPEYFAEVDEHLSKIKSLKIVSL